MWVSLCFFHVMVWAPAGLLSRFALDCQLLRGVHVGSLCFPTSWCGSASDYASVWCGLHVFPRNGVVCPMCVPWLFPRNGVASMWALIVGPAAIFYSMEWWLHAGPCIFLFKFDQDLSDCCDASTSLTSSPSSTWTSSC